MGKYKQIGPALDRYSRNDLNANFDEVDKDIQAQKDRVNRLITDSPQPDEVVDARGDAGTLGDRLSGFDDQFIENESRVKVTKSDDAMLVSAFNGLLGEELELYLSYNGTDFISLHSSSVFKPSSGGLRDPSVIYRNSYFYVTYTNNSSTGFGIARSADLKTWEEFRVTSPGGYTPAWAPEWFVDGDNVYILISMSDGTMEADFEGVSIPYFKQYYLKATNADLTTFNPPGSNEIFSNYK